MTASTKSPVMGLAEAARVCGVSVSTIRRRRAELEKLGAAQTAGGWQIPVTALIAAGLMERTTAPPETPSVDTPGTPRDTPLLPINETLRQELEALRSQLVEAERRAAVAEAVAVERERIIEVQQTSLRMLEAGKQHASEAGLGAFRNSAGSQDHPEPVLGPASAPGNSNKGMLMTKGAPQGAPFWRRLIGRR
jgi:hypothetical protein